MHAGNVFSLVKRTLFEANSGARRPEKQSLTSAQTTRLLLASPLTVNPGARNMWRKPGLGAPRCSARNILSTVRACEKESDPKQAVTHGSFMADSAQCARQRHETGASQWNHP
jgi:hypothetical protein